MKKDIIYFVVFLIPALFMAGCQPTPDTPPVVNRSEGLSPEAVMAPIEGDVAKEIEAPDIWNEEIIKGEGRVVILADEVELEIPEIQNTPILEIQEREFDNSLLSLLTDYFAGNSSLYAVPAMTKEELSYWSERIENRKGIYGHPDEKPWISSELLNIRELLEKAPDTSEREYVRPEFTSAAFSEYEYVRMGRRTDGTDPDTFQAIVSENGALIMAETRNENRGTTAHFGYQKGGYLDLTYLERAEADFVQMLEREDADLIWLEEYRTFIEKLRDGIQEVETELKPEIALRYAEKCQEDLEITELTMTEISPCIVTADSLKWDKMNVNWEKAKSGYVVQFSRKCGELAAKMPSGAFYHYDTLPEKTYAPYFYPEMITMVITAEGVQIFEWDNMASLSKVIAENTRLMPFDEIKEKFAQHLFYAAAAQDENVERSADVKETYVVDKVCLTAYYSEAYGNPKNAWVVPAWLFTYDYYRTVEGKERFVAKVSTMIHAIDGGYIQLIYGN